MKLTAKEYFDFFGGSSKEAITNKCRNGELNAEKDEKGKWIIDVSIPEEVYDARLKATEKRKYADALLRELRKTEKEIEQLMKVVMEFNQ